MRYLIIIISSLFLFSCSENPAITGFNTLNPSDSLIVTRFDSTRDSVSIRHKQIVQHDILGGTRRFLVGRYENLVAHSLIRFRLGLTSEIRDAIKNSNFSIVSARIKMNPVYKFGDAQNNSFGMEIFEVYTYFDEFKFNIDSLKSGRYEILRDNILTRSIDDDTLYYCELNSSKVLEWFKQLASDTSKKISGILLSPTSTTNIIKGFASSNAYAVGHPTVLEIIAQYNSKVDSSLKYTVDADLHVVEINETIVTDEAKIVLQSGIRTKSLIYFDISKVPYNAIVNSALLRLYPDTIASKFGTSHHDSILVQFVTDSSKISIDSAFSYTLTKTSQGYYEGQITYFVQKWIDNKNNQGLLLSTRDPDGGVDKFIFYGPQSVYIERRPQLIINYSHKK